jgi:hypothetical protein
MDTRVLFWSFRTRYDNTRQIAAKRAPHDPITDIGALGRHVGIGVQCCFWG